MKSDYSEMIRKLESKISTINDDTVDIKNLIKSGIHNLLKLHECFLTGDLMESRELIGSIYPEKFTIQENEFRTARVNEVVILIYMINKELDKNKKGQKRKILLCPTK